jgi:hypothetical protein
VRPLLLLQEATCCPHSYYTRKLANTESSRSQTLCFQPSDIMITPNTSSESQRKGFTTYPSQFEMTSQITSPGNTHPIGATHVSTIVRARTVVDISEGASQNSAPTAMVKSSTPKSSNENTTSASSSRPL